MRRSTEHRLLAILVVPFCSLAVKNTLLRRISTCHSKKRRQMSAGESPWRSLDSLCQSSKRRSEYPGASERETQPSRRGGRRTSTTSSNSLARGALKPAAPKPSLPLFRGGAGSSTKTGAFFMQRFFFIFSERERGCFGDASRRGVGMRCSELTAHC